MSVIRGSSLLAAAIAAAVTVVLCIQPDRTGIVVLGFIAVLGWIAEGMAAACIDRAGELLGELLRETQRIIDEHKQEAP